jgi:tRNA modification GTPase
MEKAESLSQECIAACATPWGMGALAIIRVSGADALEKLSGLFKPRRHARHVRKEPGGSLTAVPGHTLKFGVIFDPESGEEIDEVLVGVYHAPKSYTGENSAENICHGSPAIVKSLLDLLGKAGFRSAGPGEFTLRAFLNGKMDLTQAEAVNEIVRARTDRARSVALHRLAGSIENKIDGIKQGLLAMLASLEVVLDYPEDEIEAPPVSVREAEHWQEELQKLLATYSIGKILQEGITVVLAGATNAGKSTLFNYLLREDRAIVSELHGTTRDYLEAVISLQGVPLKLYDTAGYRHGGETIEQEGIRRTDRIVANAQLIIYLADATRGLTDLDRRFLRSCAEAEERLIRVWNKCDLSDLPPPPDFLPLNAAGGEGVPALLAEISRRVILRAPVDTETPIIDSLRQKQLLETALGALKDFRAGLADHLPLDVLAVDLKEAMDALAEITGEITSQDILNTIFASFCVGK